MTLGVLLGFLICHILTLAAPSMQGYFRDLKGVSLKVVGSDCTHMQRPAWDATVRHGILWAGAWQMCEWLDQIEECPPSGWAGPE